MPSIDKTKERADLFPFHALRASVMVLAAITLFPVVAVFVALAAPSLALLQHGSPRVLAANHLVTLGWGTLVAIGALHQMLPAAAGVRRDLSLLLPAQLIVHLVGVALLAAGFWTGVHGVQIAGGGAIVLSITWTLGSGAGVLRQRRRALPVLGYVAAALGCLVVTAAWGFLLVVNRWRGLWPPLLGSRGLGVHLIFGLLGWFAFLIVGVSYYLLPRFAGVKDSGSQGSRAVLAGLGGGATLLLAGVAATPSLTRAGLVLVGLTGGVYTRDLLRLVRAWQTRAPDIARAHWWVLMVWTAALSAGMLLSAADALPGDRLRWGVAGVTLFVLGWVTLAITGQAYKVTPFLMWYYRFRLGLSALEVPGLEAPYWPRAALPPFVLLTAAAPLIALGTLIADPRVCAVGGVAYLAGAALFSFLMGYSWLPVLWRGRRHPAAAEPR